mgnify:CR=1 FL=1|tara:strand:+ start:1560 stop:2066 length:507 start_codon:yes stop_codon:yes gene_type:complete
MTKDSKQNKDYLDEAWGSLEHFYVEDGFRQPWIGKIDDRTALEDFAFRLSQEIYPHPETMRVIGAAFNQYLESKGKISLDEAFFGNAHKQRRSLPYLLYKKSQYRQFHAQVDFYRRLLPEYQGVRKQSLESLAEDYLANLDEIDESEDMLDTQTFLKGYTRWKKEQGK